MRIHRMNAIAMVLVCATSVVAAEHSAQPLPTEVETQQQRRQATPGPHGGDLRQVGTSQAETLVLPSGIRLFVYDSQGHPLDLRSARGVVMLHVAGAPKRYRYDLFPEVRKDNTSESLAVAIDLSRVAGQKVELNLQLVGIPGTERRPAQFAASLTVPMTDSQREAAAIAEQGICPVSGQPLGSMGRPIAVDLDGQTVFVCCKGCIDRLKANPEKYLAALPKARKK